MEELTAVQHLAIARHPGRPNVTDYIAALFTDFFEQRGDRLCGEDPAILGGVALFHGHPVTVIGTRKGKNLEENLRCNFGMPSPEGYRKARRLMEQAEKFRRPIITLIDTSGAYPGLEAEARGQGEAIARNLLTLSTIRKADLILVVRDGKIVEQGKHLDLLKRGGYYHDLYSKQFASSQAFAARNTGSSSVGTHAPGAVPPKYFCPGSHSPTSASPSEARVSCPSGEGWVVL